MINILLTILFSVFSLQIFTINYKVSTFSKTLLNMPLSIFEVSVPIIGYDNTTKLYFDKNVLENYVKTYLDDNINDFCGEYKLLFVYFSTEDGLFCKTGKCDGVRITLTADIILGIQYRDTMSYFIKENSNG